jgi:hypothetical protein
MGRPASTGREGTAMNRLERLFGGGTEARVRYLAGEFQVLSAGDYVRCAVTGARIELPNLKYWSVDLQEPYATAEISMKRFLETNPDPEA